jgi:hypothetical protein
MPSFREDPSHWKPGIGELEFSATGLPVFGILLMEQLPVSIIAGLPTQWASVPPIRNV